MSLELDMATLRASGFFVSGGTMPLDSASYVERASDKALLKALSSGSYCYVLNSRQMGKSSLSVRVMSRLRDENIGAVLIDLTRIGGRNVTALQWYAGLCDEVGGALGLRAEMMAYFRQKSELSPLQRFFGAIDEVLLTENQGRIVIFIDEIDATRNLNFDADEFFAGIRECHNRRVQDPRFARLAFCLIGVAVPTDLIRNPATTPFNVGERIELSDFSLQEMAHLSEPLGPSGLKLAERVHYWTGGQPFLTQSLCEAISRDPEVKTSADVDRLVNSQLFDPKARTTNINLADVGNRALHSGATEPEPSRFQADLLTAYERIWKGGAFPDDESNRIAVMLKLSGLTRSDGRNLSVRNRIYHHVFDRTWVRENLPDRELVREKMAFRRGIVRAATASAAVVGVVAILGVAAWSSRQREVEARNALDYELYVADMNNMRLLEETGDVARMKELLVRTSKSPNRGFEWSFWQRRIHDSDEEYTLDYSAPGKREEGVLSRDRSKICVYDGLAGIASIVDRKTRKTLLTRMIGTRRKVLSLKSGFACLDETALLGQVDVKSVETGKTIFHFDPGRDRLGPTIVRPAGDFILLIAVESIDPPVREVCLYEIESGKAVFKKVVSGQRAEWPISFSKNGHRVLYSVTQPDVSSTPPIQMVAVDTLTGKTQSFSLPKGTEVNDFFELSESGKFVLFQNKTLGTVCYDIDKGKIVSTKPTEGPDVPISAFTSGNDQVAGALYGSGHADFYKVSNGDPVASVRQVWDLSPSPDLKEMVASSTSVRVVSPVASGAGSVIGPGSRVMRNGSGEIAIWAVGGRGLDFYRDPDLEFTGHYEGYPNQRSGYTYNSRWCMVGDSHSSGIWIADSKGAQPAVRFDDAPVNYSCGNTIDLIAILGRPGIAITGVSGRTGERLWSYPLPGRGVTSLWTSPDNLNVLVGIGDTELMVLDGKTGKLRTRFDGHNVKLSNLAFTAGGRLVFTCGGDGRAILWDLITGKRVREFKGNVAQRIACADLSPDRTRVATCNLAGAWQLWDAKTGIQLMEIQASSMALRSILFTADGRSLVTGGDDGLVRKWGILDKDPTTLIPVPPELLKGIRN